MLFETSYDTLIGARNQKAISVALQNCLAANTLQSLDFNNGQTGTNTTIHFVRGGQVQEDSVPFFAHPFSFYDASRQTRFMVVDLRQFGVYDPRQQTYKVRDRAGLHLAVTRALLERYQNEGGLGTLRDLSPIPAAVFSRMISQNIAYRFNLNPGAQVRLSVYAAYYYHCLYEDQPIKEHEEFMLRTIMKVSRCTRTDTQTVLDMIKDMPAITNIDEFCEGLPGFVDSVELQKFETATLMQLIAHLLYGTSASEILGVAMEHTPTWLALCYAALSDATYSRSRLTAAAHDAARDGEGERYTKGIGAIIDSKAISAMFD